MARQIKSGEGWRLGWDPDASEFCGLVGGEDWAIELTKAELDDFCRLILELKAALSQMEQELMEEERICCEVESAMLWLEAEGSPHRHTLRLIVLTGRRGEGFWSETAVLGLVQGIQGLKVF